MNRTDSSIKKNFEEAQKDYQNNIIEKYRDNLLNDIFNPSKTRLREFDFFFKHANLKKNSNILEIGCGSGVYSIQMLKQGHELTAIDISKESIGFLKSVAGRLNLDKKLNTINKSIYELSSLNMKYDHVVCIDVLHHLEESENIFEIIKNLLIEGGSFIAFEPNGSFLPWRINSILNKALIWEYEKGIRNIRLKELEKSLINSGFKNIENYYYCSTPTSIRGIWDLLSLFLSLIFKINLLKKFSPFILIKANK